MLSFVDKLKDPIWGWIPITKTEKEIINSQAFIRLRYVKQMSMAYVTYSGANHTRYEHSVGTLYVAYSICASIPKIEDYYKKEKYDIAIQCLRIAALLHDVGHPPFSHAVEWVFKKNPELSPFKNYSHDEYTRKIIEEDVELKGIMDRYLKFISDWFSQKGAEFKTKGKDFRKAIAALAVGDDKVLVQQKDEFLKSLTLLSPIMNGDLDADKIDYILRDNYHCGFPTGVDFGEILGAFDLYFFKGHSQSKLLLKQTHISTVETLLYSRLKMIDQIHHERKNRIANQMLMRTVAKIVEGLDKSLRNRTIKEMHTEWTDNKMYGLISENAKKIPYGKRVFREQFLKYELYLTLPTLPPATRRNLYLISDFPEYVLKIQEEIGRIIRADVHVDLRFISPPPLTLQLAEGEKPHYLFYASSIIEGILLESFRRSNIAIYSDSEKIGDASSGQDKFRQHESAQHKSKEENEYIEIRNKVIDIVDNFGGKIRSQRRKEIEIGDFIICVLVGVEKFAKENLNNTSVWVYKFKGLQRFIYTLTKERFKWNLSNLEERTKEEYDPRFYKEVQQLVFCGFINERKKEFEYPVPPIFFSQTSDFKINFFGKSYYEENLSSFYTEIVKNVFNREARVKNLIKESIDFDKKIDKSKHYEEYRKKAKSIGKEITDSGGCILVT